MSMHWEANNTSSSSFPRPSSLSSSRLSSCQKRARCKYLITVTFMIYFLSPKIQKCVYYLIRNHLHLEVRRSVGDGPCSGGHWTLSLLAPFLWARPRGIQRMGRGMMLGFAGAIGTAISLLLVVEGSRNRWQLSSQCVTFRRGRRFWLQKKCCRLSTCLERNSLGLREAWNAFSRQGYQLKKVNGPVRIEPWTTVWQAQPLPLIRALCNR